MATLCAKVMYNPDLQSIPEFGGYNHPDLGHNTVSINDPNAIKQIYGSERFLKPPFYKAFTYDVTH
jgi:hypothetical protein